MGSRRLPAVCPQHSQQRVVTEWIEPRSFSRPALTMYSLGAFAGFFSFSLCHTMTGSLLRRLYLRDPPTENQMGSWQLVEAFRTKEIKAEATVRIMQSMSLGEDVHEPDRQTMLIVVVGPTLEAQPDPLAPLYFAE